MLVVTPENRAVRPPLVAPLSYLDEWRRERYRPRTTRGKLREVVFAGVESSHEVGYDRTSGQWRTAVELTRALVVEHQRA